MVPNIWKWKHYKGIQDGCQSLDKMAAILSNDSKKEPLLFSLSSFIKKHEHNTFGFQMSDIRIFNEVTGFFWVYWKMLPNVSELVNNQSCTKCDKCQTGILDRLHETWKITRIPFVVCCWSQVLGSQVAPSFLDDVMSYNSLTTYVTSFSNISYCINCE